MFNTEMQEAIKRYVPALPAESIAALAEEAFKISERKLAEWKAEFLKNLATDAVGLASEGMIRAMSRHNLVRAEDVTALVIKTLDEARRQAKG